MKNIALILILSSHTLLAQLPYSSLVGRYNRDKASNFDPTDYSFRFPPCPLGNGVNTETIVSSITFRGYNENQNYSGIGEVSYYFKFNGSNQCPGGGKSNLTKPVIVLDGFDPLDSRSGAKIYGKYLRYFTNENGIGVKKYLGNILREASSGFDIVVLNFPQYQRGGFVTQTYNCPLPISYVPPPGGQTRDQVCASLGYTGPGGTRIITSGSPATTIDGGADYIERNAMVLIELIERTNQTLKANGSNEQITIIGPSMGGLISRYALAYMEKNNIPHNCRLWLSFDAPHLGANIALGDQWWVEFIADRSGAETAKEANEKQLNSIAARQLLLFHKLARSEGSPTGAIVDGINYRDKFVSNLENNGSPGSLGFPTLPRKVCLINGAINGSLQKVINSGEEQSRVILACEKAFTCEIKLSKSTRALALLSCGFGFLFGCVAAAPITLSASKVYFQPSYGNRCRVFEGSFPVNRGDKRDAGSFGNSISLDVAPGGYYTTQDDLASGERNEGFFSNWEAAISKFPDTQVKFYSVIDNHSFIPTKSALAYKWNDKDNIGDLGENLSLRSLVCENTIPFDTYYAPDKNEEHVSLSASSAAFALNEIKGIPQLPLEGPPLLLETTGNALPCQDSDVSVTVSLPVGGLAGYEWRVSAGLLVVGGGGINDKFVTVKARPGNPNYSQESVSLLGKTNCSSFLTPAVYIVKGGELPSGTTIKGEYRYNYYNTQALSFSGANVIPIPRGNGKIRVEASASVTGPPLQDPTWKLEVANNGNANGVSILGSTVSFDLELGATYVFTISSNLTACRPFTKTVAFYGQQSYLFSTYPNPAENEFTVERTAQDSSQVASNRTIGSKESKAQIQIAPAILSADKEFSIGLYSPFGDKVWVSNSQGSQAVVNTFGLATGVYTLKIYSQGQLIETQQVIIAH